MVGSKLTSRTSDLEADSTRDRYGGVMSHSSFA